MTCASPVEKTDPSRDRLRREAAVAGDHEDADAGVPAAGDRVGDLRSWRVEHADEPEQLEVLLDGIGVVARVGRQDAAGEGEDAQGVVLHRGLCGGRLAAVLGGERRARQDYSAAPFT